jgi:hypothetical protein
MNALLENDLHNQPHSGLNYTAGFVVSSNHFLRQLLIGVVICFSQ